MKKSLFFIFLFLFPLSADAQNLEHPPIPEESPETEQVAIITVPRELSEKEIERMIRPFPDIELRHIFKHALKGFSVKGSLASLEGLSQSTKVDLVSPVKTYKVQKEENLQIIGADLARGLFDNNNHRLTGKGIKVGVIDTGIDYRHEDLRRSYKGGHDLVDGDDDPMESEGTDGPSTLHGTHVAGIIAANGKIHGVAPEAEVIAYRALGPGGSGTTEQVLAAIEQAIKDKVDVLNLSLGNNVNGPDLPISLALNKAAEEGIVPVTSSGNSGPNLWTVGSPGTATRAISVGATTPPMKIPYLSLDGQTEKIRLEPMQGSDRWDLDRSYPMEFGGLGKPEELKGVKGKIALIERGEIPFTEKAHNAYERGAIAVIIYNHLGGSFIGNLEGEVDLPVATISKKDGEKLRKMLKTNHHLARTHMVEEKDILADFSSRGPVTSTWEIKPDVVAPGVAINSTIPGGYLALQGTSMAAPHVAGACALIKQAHPEWTPEEIKAALMNTAKPITDVAGRPYRTYEQGAGRIQVEEAIKTKSLVIPSSLQFGKFKLAEEPHEHMQYVTVRNVSDRHQSYSFHIPKNEEGIKWDMPLSFTLGPKEKKKVAIRMKVDPKAFKKKIHDGYLELKAGQQEMRLPYLYVLEEPNYPRVMGFDFGVSDEKGTYQYEVYLPGGAEEFGIALFHPDTYQFVGFLETRRKVGRGLLKAEVKVESLPEPGLYIAKVFAKRAGKEDMIETSIFIPS